MRQSKMRLGITRGTKIRIISGSYAGRTGTLEATVFQKTVDSDELAHAYHITLDDGRWLTVRREQVRLKRSEPRFIVHGIPQSHRWGISGLAKR